MEKTMTMHQLLSELKTLDARIESKMQGANSGYAAVIQKGKNIYGSTLDQFKMNECAEYQSLVDLISYKLKLEQAKIQSNATTMVTINGQEMSVSAALAYKDKVLHYYTQLLRVFTTKYAQLQQTLETKNNEVTRQAETYVAQIFGSKESVKSDVAIDTLNKYYENNQFILVDSINLKEQIEKLTTLINQLTIDFDAQLSISNATTVVTIDC